MEVVLDQNAFNALGCPSCRSPFAGSIIFQCMNGHAMCEDCRDVRLAMQNPNCRSCKAPITGAGEIRCRPLETVINGMLFPCAFVRSGCTRRVTYAEKPVHEASCPNGPCECPFPECDYAALRLHDHIQTAHAAARATFLSPQKRVASFVGSALVTVPRTTEFMVLLHAADGHVFLLLNRGNDNNPLALGGGGGRSLSVVCLGARAAGETRMLYKLEVDGGGVPGTLALSAAGAVPHVRRRWTAHDDDPTAAATEEGSLLVPDAYWNWNNTRSVSVTVHVWKPKNDDDKALLRELLSFFYVFAVMVVLLAVWHAWKAS